MRASLDPDFDQRLSAWMSRAQDGDARAYESLLTEVTAHLTKFVRQRLVESEWVDDVVQEALISIHQNRHTYDPRRSFSAWMHAIALHRLIDLARKRRRVRARERLDESGPEDAGFALEAPADGTAFDGLYRALAKLSHKQREVIQLLKWQGFSVKEVAESTGMSESSVKVSAHRGYRLLRKLLVSGTDED
jgi:RNA polymerase sigma-70 factor (ECF subfamily)